MINHFHQHLKLIVVMLNQRLLLLLQFQRLRHRLHLPKYCQLYCHLDFLDQLEKQHRQPYQHYHKHLHLNHQRLHLHSRHYMLRQHLLQLM